MSAFVYRVTLTTRHPTTGVPFFINFECGFPSLADLVADLNDGLVVTGEALFCKPGSEKNVFEVTKRKPFALGRNGVAHIEPPDVRFVEYVETSHGHH